MRGKIPLDIPRGEKEKEPKAILIELMDIYDEFQLDDNDMIENCQKGGKNGQIGKEKYGQKGKEEKGQKERRFLQFVARCCNSPPSSASQANEFGYAGTNKFRLKPRPWLSKIHYNYFWINAVLRDAPTMLCCWWTQPIRTSITCKYAAIDAFNALDEKFYVANEEGNSCPICKCEIVPGTMVKPLSCNHIFHNECISAWLSNHITCPYCRFEMATQSAVGVSSSGQENGATNGNGVAQSTAAVGNPPEVVIDMPSNGQNGGNTVGTGTDDTETNRHNNGTANVG
ncbi:hypothetical protein niasHS_012470 [Heterodera schachtii]|uniref:RING-type domain-containing protein n=1 Tax=Heterodera schachtii TaxID=97005 RepID=A0ABD2IDL8_HETSC